MNWREFRRSGRALNETISDSSLEGLRKTTYDLNEDSQGPGRGSNTVTPVYNLKYLPLEPTCLVITLKEI
jgi:hypothetical protein